MTRQQPLALVGRRTATIVRHGREGPEQKLLLGETLEGLAMGLAMNAHVGHRVHPLAGSRVEGAKRGDVQAVEEVLLRIPHSVLHAALFVTFSDLAGDRLKAIMGGKIQVAGIKTRGQARGMLQHPGLKIINHDLSGGAAEELQRVAVTGKELFHALQEGELDINHAAVTKHHHKEREAAARGAHRDGAVTAPIDLGAFAGGKLQHQEGRLAHRAHHVHKRLEDAGAAGVALGFDLLEDLLGGVAVALQHGHDRAFERVELAGPLPTLALLIGGTSHPERNRSGVQL